MVNGAGSVNLMNLGQYGLHSPGLGNRAIRTNFESSLRQSGGNATTYPIDHLTEHGALYYAVRGMHRSFDIGAMVEVAQEGKVMAMAVLPGLGQAIGQYTKGSMPLIWKFNIGASMKLNGDSVTTRLYRDARESMRVAVQYGARFWGATYYGGSNNRQEMMDQLTQVTQLRGVEG